MPIERREIRLTEDELLRAIDDYGCVTPGLLPPGVLRGADVTPSAGAPGAGGLPTVTATIRMPPEPIAEDVQIELSPASVFEMLIRFCREENIPIPRSGVKSVHVVDGLLTLVVDHRGAAPTPKAG